MAEFAGDYRDMTEQSDDTEGYFDEPWRVGYYEPAGGGTFAGVRDEPSLPRSEP